MSFKTFCFTSVAALVLTHSAIAYSSQMMFKNHRGSLLEVNILEDNKVEGYFTTAVASKSCPEVVNQKRPITGYVVGNALTFAVVYPTCGSVLSVTGNFTTDKKFIDTISILNKQAEDIIHEGPGARYIGHDLFEKTD